LNGSTAIPYIVGVQDAKDGIDIFCSSLIYVVLVEDETKGEERDSVC
jgi:hypothetical protein